MIRLLYDGSFDGLLCALAAALKQPHGQEISLEPSAEAQITFGDSLEYIETRADLSSKIYLRIEERFGEEVLKDFYSAFLFPGSEDLILEYLRLLTCSQRPSGVLSHPTLRELEKRILRIRREVHRYKGFLRFRRLDGEIYYADYAPAFDITSLLMPHFRRRFPSQKLIIHDVIRNLAGIFDGQRTIYTKPAAGDLPFFSSDEETALLWKNYLRHLSIEERANPRLQQNQMPKKYRKYMTETR